MSDDTFDSEKKWSNVQGSRSKSRAWKQSEGVDQDKAESAQSGVRRAGAQSPGEAMSESWNNLKSGISNLLGGKKK
jgi:hypothetical protein